MGIDAPLQLTVSLPGLPSYTTALSRFREDIGDWRPFWSTYFAPFFYRQTLENFVTEGSATGQTWAPLSPAYAAWKARRFPGAGILMRSGVLKASLTGPNAPYSVFRPSPTSLEIGSVVPYGIFHQLGGGHLPQRPPLRVNEPFMRVVGQSLQQFVQDAWARRRAGITTVLTPVQAPGGGGGLI